MGSASVWKQPFPPSSYDGESLSPIRNLAIWPHLVLSSDAPMCFSGLCINHSLEISFLESHMTFCFISLEGGLS